MPAAVLTVHQLRFQLAFGDSAHAKLASEGHQYLGALAVASAMLLATGVGVFLANLVRAWRSGRDDQHGRRRASFAKLWLLAAVMLLAIYCGQELLEGALASGHPGGIAGVFGEGGLWAIPLSLLLGGVVALALQVADAAIDLAAARRKRTASRPRVCHASRPKHVVLALREPLADAAAGRAPPALAFPIS